MGKNIAEIRVDITLTALQAFCEGKALEEVIKLTGQMNDSRRLLF